MRTITFDVSNKAYKGLKEAARACGLPLRAFLSGVLAEDIERHARGDLHVIGRRVYFKPGSRRAKQIQRIGAEAGRTFEEQLDIMLGVAAEKI